MGNEPMFLTSYNVVTSISLISAIAMTKKSKVKGDLDSKHARLMPQKVKQVICLPICALTCKFGSGNAH